MINPPHHFLFSFVRLILVSFFLVLASAHRRSGVFASWTIPLHVQDR